MGTDTRRYRIPKTCKTGELIMFSFQTINSKGQVQTVYISLDDLQKDFPNSWETMSADEIISAYSSKNLFANY